MGDTTELWPEFCIKRGKNATAQKKNVYHNSLYLHRSAIQRVLQDAAHQCMDKTFITDTTTIDAISARQNEALTPLFTSIGPGAGTTKISAGGCMWYNIGCKLAMAACGENPDTNAALGDTLLARAYEESGRRFQMWSLTVASTLAFFKNAPLLLQVGAEEWDSAALFFQSQIRLSTTKSKKPQAIKRADTEATASNLMIAFLKYFYVRTSAGGVQRNAYTRICQVMASVLTDFMICDHLKAASFVINGDSAGRSLANATSVAFQYAEKVLPIREKASATVVNATKLRILDTVLNKGGTDGARQALVERPRRHRMPAEIYERSLIQLGLGDEIGETLDRFRYQAALELDAEDTVLLPLPLTETNAVLSDSSSSQYFQDLSRSIDLSVSAASSIDSDTPRRGSRRGGSTGPTPAEKRVATPGGILVFDSEDERPPWTPTNTPTDIRDSAPSPADPLEALSFDTKIRYFTNQFMNEFTEPGSSIQQDEVLYCLGECIDTAALVYMRECTTMVGDLTLGLQNLQLLLFGMERVAKVQQARCQRYFTMLQYQANVYEQYSNYRGTPLGAAALDVEVNRALRIDSGDKVFLDKSYKQCYVAKCKAREYWLHAKHVCAFAAAAYVIIENSITAMRGVEHAQDVAAAKSNLFQTLKNTRVAKPAYVEALGNDEALMHMHLITIGLVSQCSYDMLHDHEGSDTAFTLHKVTITSNEYLVAVQSKLRSSSYPPQYRELMQWISGVLLMGSHHSSSSFASSYTSSSYTSSSADDSTSAQSPRANARQGKHPHPSIAQLVAVQAAAADFSSGSDSSSDSRSY